MNKAMKETDSLFRLRHIIAMAVGPLYMACRQQKPFNPILGETFQATFPYDGTEVYFEHISHHPPISSFHLIGKPNEKGVPTWEIYGSYEMIAKMSKNNLNFHAFGSTHVVFKDTG